MTMTVNRRGSLSPSGFFFVCPALDGGQDLFRVEPRNDNERMRFTIKAFGNDGKIKIHPQP